MKKVILFAAIVVIILIFILLSQPKSPVTTERITFAENGNIYTVNTDGTDKKQITTNGKSDESLDSFTYYSRPQGVSEGIISFLKCGIIREPIPNSEATRLLRDDCQIIEYNLKTQESKTLFEGKNIYDYEWSPTGETFAFYQCDTDTQTNLTATFNPTSGETTTLRSFEDTAFKCKRDFLTEERSGNFEGVRFSPDGKYVLTYKDPSIHVYKTDDRSEVFSETRGQLGYALNYFIGWIDSESFMYRHRDILADSFKDREKDELDEGLYIAQLNDGGLEKMDIKKQSLSEKNPVGAVLSSNNKLVYYWLENAPGEGTSFYSYNLETQEHLKLKDNVINPKLSGDQIILFELQKCTEDKCGEVDDSRDKYSGYELSGKSILYNPETKEERQYFLGIQGIFGVRIDADNYSE